MEWFQCILSNKQTMALGIIINFQLIIFFSKEKVKERIGAHRSAFNRNDAHFNFRFTGKFIDLACQRYNKQTHNTQLKMVLWYLTFYSFIFSFCRLSIRFRVPSTNCTFTHTHMHDRNHNRKKRFDNEHIIISFRITYNYYYCSVFVVRSIPLTISFFLLLLCVLCFPNGVLSCVDRNSADRKREFHQL